MTRNTSIRKRRGTAWTSDSSKRANKARWAADRARRDAEEPDRLRDLAAQHAAHPPITDCGWTKALDNLRPHLASLT